MHLIDCKGHFVAKFLFSALEKYFYFEEVYFSGPAEVFYHFSDCSKLYFICICLWGYLVSFVFRHLRKGHFWWENSFSSVVRSMWSHMDLQPPFTKHPQMHQMCAAWANSASSPVRQEIYKHKYIIGVRKVQHIFKIC